MNGAKIKIGNAQQAKLCTHAYLPVKMEQSVPKRRNINFRRRGITQKKAYNPTGYLEGSLTYQ
jgi:hypothetical protein